MWVEGVGGRREGARVHVPDGNVAGVEVKDIVLSREN